MAHDQQMQNRTTYSDAELERRSQFDRSRPLERDETSDLISSDKVEGTAVYSTDGEKLGTIDHLMIGKRSGRVEYSVMSFGGFLGIGEHYHPVPWDALDYDTRRGGYIVNIDKGRLRDAPSYSRNERPEFNREYGENVYAYYGVLY
ncbi:PRC-barrel domain-containing protein [Aurantiacibacter odishensis]|uniref:PRC-barrel domain-containing protein n=1 Tax=Aurantiacibacter odishensis TaxID=1155476 RepID=UPI001F0C5D74|nr:PRC-barrel domain-containing protein [Aurantiacibacter odishensis]